MRKHAGFFKWVIGMWAVAALFHFISIDDAATAELHRQAYCEDVAIWLRDASLGVPEHERFGHPDYDGVYHEMCR